MNTNNIWIMWCKTSNAYTMGPWWWIGDTMLMGHNGKSAVDALWIIEWGHVDVAVTWYIWRIPVMLMH